MRNGRLWPRWPTSAAQADSQSAWSGRFVSGLALVLVAVSSPLRAVPIEDPREDAEPRTVAVAAGPHYAAGPLRRFFFGEGSRSTRRKPPETASPRPRSPTVSADSSRPGLASTSRSRPATGPSRGRAEATCAREGASSPRRSMSRGPSARFTARPSVSFAHAVRCVPLWPRASEGSRCLADTPSRTRPSLGAPTRCAG